MQILESIWPLAIFALFFSSALADTPTTSTSAKSSTGTQSIPACAASPTAFDEYLHEFWIEVVFPSPTPDLPGQRKGYSLRVEEDFNPHLWPLLGNDYFDLTFDRTIITRDDLVRNLFVLHTERLTGPLRGLASLWPDQLSVGPYIPAGFNPLDFGENTRVLDHVYGADLQWTIVKVCTPDNEIDLQLRGRKADPIEGGGTLLIPSFYPPVVFGEIEVIMKLFSIKTQVRKGRPDG